ncbi:MAG: c-type cytochrome [Deltaproteobacteria bacterium]|nr:c-type cytochrome [Deltaproteobacteria bacterium]
MKRRTTVLWVGALALVGAGIAHAQLTPSGDPATDPATPSSDAGVPALDAGDTAGDREAAPSVTSTPAEPAASDDRPAPRAPVRAAPSPYRVTPELVRLGRRAFADRCTECHGTAGRGDGPDARFLSPPPRDLTRGVFAIRSTLSGQLPTDWDIYRTLRRGMPGTGMPAWSGVPERELWALVAFIKTLSPRFRDESAGEPIIVPPAPPATEASIVRGRRAYQRMGCTVCHGIDGRGRGPGARTLVDDQGRRAYPFDFTRGWMMKGGSSPEDVYRTFHTGIDGTPMPSYHDVIDAAESWDLVHYTRSLFVQ